MFHSCHFTDGKREQNWGTKFTAHTLYIGLVVFFGLTAIIAKAFSKPLVVSTPEIVVTASRVPIPSREVGSSISIITGEEIEKKQLRSLSEVLRKIPAVAVSRTGPVGAFTQIRIRGAEGNHTLVIIDGVEINDVSGGSEFDFGNMIASDIDRLEVLRGPQTALYGSDAVGGVINIITKKGKGPATATLSVEAGSQKSGRVQSNIRGGGEKYHYSLGLTGSATEGFSVADTDAGNTETDGNYHRNTNLSFGFEPVKDLELNFFARYHTATQETDDQPAVAGKIVTVDTADYTRTRQRSGRFSIRYNLMDGKWENQAGIGFSDDKSESLTNSAPSRANGAKSQFDYQSNFFFQTPDHANADHSLTFRFDYERDSQATASNFGSSNLSVINKGFLGEYRVSLWNQLFFSGGIRFDKNDMFKNRKSYRSTAAYLIPELDMRVHGSIGTGAKNPTLFELFGYGPNFVANSDLETETSVGWDLGIEQVLYNGEAKVDVTYFKNLITDLINGAGSTAVNVNGTSIVNGVEVSGSVNLSNNLSIKGQYTYTLGQDANKTQLTRRPRHLASVNANYLFLNKRANFNIGLDYSGVQRDIEFSNFFASSARVNLDQFFLLNLAGSYEINKNIQIYARIENALDTKYEEVLDFSGPGIRGFLGVRTKYNF